MQEETASSSISGPNFCGAWTAAVECSYLELTKVIFETLALLGIEIAALIVKMALSVKGLFK